MGTNYLHGLVNQPVFLRNEPTLGGPTIRNDSKVLLSPVESMTIIGSDKGALNRSKTGNDFNTFNLSKSYSIVAIALLKEGRKKIQDFASKNC